MITKLHAKEDGQLMELLTTDTQNQRLSDDASFTLTAPWPWTRTMSFGFPNCNRGFPHQ